MRAVVGPQPTRVPTSFRPIDRQDWATIGFDRIVDLGKRAWANLHVVSFYGLSSVLALTLGQRAGQAAETRFALVIGNDEYKAAKLATPANDAGLVADALQAAGFTVTGARNLDQATLRKSFREFLGQVSAAGPDTVALVYLAGFGLQFEGENYFVPVDADIQRDVDIPLQAIRISDFTQPLAAMPGRVKIVILDAARQNPFARGGQPLASGLALVDPAPSWRSRSMRRRARSAPTSKVPTAPMRRRSRK